MSQIPSIEPYAIPGEIKTNTAHWHVDPERAVLLIHDMQNYFLRFFPSNTNPLLDLVKNTARLRDACSITSIPVAYTAQSGSMTSAQRGLLKDFWGPGMTTAPEEREIITSLAPKSSDWLLTKWRYSAFVKTDLLEKMREVGRDQLIICGVYAHVGILATALDAFAQDIEPFIVSDATADFTPEDHSMALEYASQRCAYVATTRQTLTQMEQQHETQLS
ncbi:isochorismatase family protein [Sedimenticola sp.]|uniref:isochorismatase family protein n=1 Tax=Sedimenticola sp. TaxID=1940285 RepID=UPI003D0B2564